MKKILFIIFAYCVMLTPSHAIEYGIDRPGGDYKNFNISNNPQVCKNHCINESSCKAWTFVRPGHQGASARCWLKNRIPAAKNASCCSSGFKKTTSTIEYGIDRPGKDYKNFNISNNPQICKNHCINESSCKAWTFVRPGHQGASARCWLKNRTPAAKNAAYSVSGVKRVVTE